MQIEIEKDKKPKNQLKRYEPLIPTKGRAAMYPFRIMDIDDSFYIERTAAQVLAAVKMFNRSFGKNMVFYIEEEGEGVRVWRIK